jgi:exopolysaccharide biosynthesis protein
MIENFFKWLAALFLSITVVSPSHTLTPTASPTSNPTPSVAPKLIATAIPTMKPTVLPIITNNTPPNSGYSRQTVKTEVGSFTISIVAANLSTTKVIVDTASSTDCASNCPVLSLGDYVSRNGGWAGINGSYFCPRDYSNCAGKENTFDLLVMNKDKHYFNSDNNVYSTNPVVGFRDGSMSFVTAGSQWGRDTSLNGVIMNYPLMVHNGNVVFGGDGDPKKGSRGSRSFVAGKGNNIYIGVTQNVTVAENALVMKALGMENALNLDSGGSTALWHGGYKVGPGRGIPNAIIFKM